MDFENKYGMLETQKYFLPIMDHIDGICRKHGIRYTLSDGTLLGAVRHKGFIPWDDDIDIALDRKNYKKLLAVLKSELGSEYTIVRDIWLVRVTRKDNSRKNSIPPERCLDLFVFDNAPDNAAANRIKDTLIKILQGMLKKDVRYKGFSSIAKAELFITHMIGLPFSQKTKQKWFDKVSQWGNGRQCAKKARYGCMFKNISRVRFPSDITSEYTELEFEGRKYMAIKQWDTFLSVVYGNYMELPAEEERVPQHIKD
ncbi:MAG: LicD family protein [Ruminococcus sp.]|uniref:LicD family protein n=1 Tax=Ruminococcus sp. TaxID=41978 RepID=UPI0025CD9545|nr:LicD family protein [Ruminococcus sp.]MCR5600122.1 LicD family protein [Ruminococcus sp.]